MKKNILLFLLSSFCKNVCSQTDVTITGNLYIGSATDIFYAGGNLWNKASAALVNNGQLYVNGTITNDQPAMATGTGTLFLNGYSTQAINGSQPFTTHHLQTGNAAGIILNNDLVVNGMHTFVAGLVTTNATHFLVYRAGAGYTGETNNSHVNGWVKKYGNSNFSFPVGNGTYLRKVNISNLSASSEVNCRYAGPTTNTTSLHPSLMTVNSNEHWEINKVAGGTAQVTLNWEHQKIPFPGYILTYTRAAQYQGNQWMTAEGTAIGDSSSTGSVTSAALFTFGRMTIGRVNTPLPLFFLAVTAKHEAGVNKIEWKTSNEWNVNRFEIQKSTSGFGFSTIASMPARNSPNEQVYTFYDRPVSLGKNFYRIRNIDMDGRTGNSKIVSVFLSGKQILKILTNPITSEIIVAVPFSSGGPYQFQLLTMDGKAVQSGIISGSSGNLRIQLRAGISSGTYILILKNEQLNFTQKVIVE